MFSTYPFTSLKYKIKKDIPIIKSLCSNNKNNIYINDPNNMISKLYFKQSQVKLEQSKWNYPMTTDSEHTSLKNKDIC